ncbi:MAG: PTS sugar transporter subunit IIC [Peptoniphilaceae bacterium]|nr:PTS sugar transporter subunit IIC [Peptoniphilaceae bacterium]MDY6018292.1 PTS sugar transporter subunit IIC [Anaerococcus sp.]
MSQTKKYTFKEFMMTVLGGVSIAIIVGLVPNAIAGEIFKALQDKASIFKSMLIVVNISQLAVPALVGALVSKEFNLDLIETGVVTMITFISSGSIKPTDKGFMIAGIGDLINSILMVSIAVFVVLKLRGKFGNLNIVLLPLLLVVILGSLGLFTLPHVSSLTGAVGMLVEKITTLQPLLMSILLSMIFAILIISPFSTVAVALAIGLSGLGSGAANIGICSTTAVLVIGSSKVNNAGTTIAVLLGSPKMFMKNWIAHPKLNLPLVLTSAISGVFAYIFNIQGTPASAGFGFSGLVGPINAISFMKNGFGQNLLVAFIAFFLVPFAASFIINKVFVDILKVYDYKVYEFRGK